MLVSIPQFMATTGICAGYFTCYGTVHIASSIAWRLPFIIAAILAVGLAISCLYLPESPRWLLLRARRNDALRESERLNLSRVEVEKDMLTIATRSQSQPSLWQGLSVVFYRRYRARTTLGLFILGMIQLCGIDGVLYVSFSGPPKQPKTLRLTVSASSVRADTLCSGWLTKRYGFISCIWPVCNPYACYLYPCNNIRR